MDFGVACAAHGTPGREIDQAVAGPQFAGRAAHALQSFAGHGFAVRLAVAFAAQEEHRITAENQRADRRSVSPGCPAIAVAMGSVTVGISMPEKSRVVAISALE